MATSLTLQNDASLAQGYIQVNGTTSATFTTSGITGNLTGNVTGNVTGNLTGNVTGNLTGNVTGSLTSGGSLTLATAQTASGTSVDFTGIPSWVKRITVMFSGVSLSGISSPLIQIGSGSVQNTGYVATSGITSGVSTISSTAGFPVYSQTPTVSQSGCVSIVLVGSNVYVASGVVSILTNSTATVGGTVTLSGILTQLRITTVNGADTFDAGTINISYEG